jgi:hypothetical protein
MCYGTVLHKERRGYLQNLQFFVGRSVSLPVHEVTHFSLFVVMGGECAVGVPNLFTAIILFFKGAFTVMEHANFNPVQFS